MPDFMIEHSWQCSAGFDANVGGYYQSGLFGRENMYPTCTCPAYRFGKRTEFFNHEYHPQPCKHIKQAQSELCGWMGFVDGDEDKVDPDDPRCPRCGAPAERVQIAV
jgi:hypothetical protein